MGTILGGSNIGKLADKNSRANIREKISHQPMRRLHLQRYKDKAKDTEVFGKINKGILTQIKGLTIDFEQKSVWYDMIKFSDEGIYQEQ